MAPKKAAEKAGKASPKKAAKGEKKEKKEKDPNAPKRPMSAYFLFSNEIRDKVKNENPEAKLGELAKIIGAKWGEMSDKEKEPYAKKAETEKARYEKEKEKYLKTKA